MSNVLLTVSDIADRLAEPELGYDRARIIRQLRHWTLAGILRPIGPKHTGVGRHRQYGEEALIVAALLLELSATLGMNVGMLEGAAFHLYEMLSDDGTSLSNWKARATKEPLYLRLSFDRVEGLNDPFCAVSGLLVASAFAETEGPIGTSAVVVDLSRLLDRVKH